MTQSRTHTCGELRMAHAGQKVTLCGFMENVREVGSTLSFIVLRDFYGVTQIVAETEEMVALVKSLNKESTISVTGTVRERDSKNPKLPTGDIEIVPDCTMTDGLLDVFVVEAEATAQLLKPLMAGFMDHDGSVPVRPHITSFRGREVRVEASAPMELEIDGDPMEGRTSSYYARVIPASNRLVVDALSRYAHEAQTSDAPLFGNTEQMPFPL